MLDRSKSNWVQAVSAWRCRDMGSMPHSSPLHVLWSKKTWQVLKESIKVVCLQQVCVKPEVPKIHPVWCCAQATDANTYKMFQKLWTNLHLRHVVCFSLRKDSNWTVTRTKINELSNVGRLALGSLVRRVVGELQPELRLWPWPTEHPWVLPWFCLHTWKGRCNLHWMFQSLQDFHWQFLTYYSYTDYTDYCSLSAHLDRRALQQSVPPDPEIWHSPSPLVTQDPKWPKWTHGIHGNTFVI